MGTFNKGILGGFSGKVGTVVGATWRGKDVMRSLPRKSNKPATVVQQVQRDKFTMVTEFLAPLNPIIKRYFGSNTGSKTRRNLAMSYHIKEAIMYVDPDLLWEYNKVMISRGELLGLNDAVATPGTGQSVDFTWTDNSGTGGAEATDQLVVVIYEPISKRSVYSLNAGVRSSEMATVLVPNYFTGLPVEVWATFAASDEKQYATSQYLGSVLIG